MNLTHRLNTANPESSLNRDKTIKSHWFKIVNYYLGKCEKIVLRYWPGEFQHPEDDQISIYGVKELESHKVFEKSINNGMKQLICSINDKTVSIVMRDEEENEHLIPWFHLELWSQNNERLFTSEDHGAGVLFHLTKEGLDYLLKNGVANKDLIELEKPIN